MDLIKPGDMEFEYTAVTQYECPRAMEFSIGVGETKTTLEFTCSWDGDWMGDVSPASLPPCICEYSRQGSHFINAHESLPSGR